MADSKQIDLGADEYNLIRRILSAKFSDFNPSHFDPYYTNPSRSKKEADLYCLNLAIWNNKCDSGTSTAAIAFDAAASLFDEAISRGDTRTSELMTNQKLLLDEIHKEGDGADVNQLPRQFLNLGNWARSFLKVDLIEIHCHKGEYDQANWYIDQILHPAAKMLAYSYLYDSYEKKGSSLLAPINTFQSQMDTIKNTDFSNALTSVREIPYISRYDLEKLMKFAEKTGQTDIFAGLKQVCQDRKFECDHQRMLKDRLTAELENATISDINSEQKARKQHYLSSKFKSDQQNDNPLDVPLFVGTKMQPDVKPRPPSWSDQQNDNFLNVPVYRDLPIRRQTRITSWSDQQNAPSWLEQRDNLKRELINQA